MLITAHASFFFFFKILFIYLSGIEGERASEHRQTERQAEAEGEAGSPPSKEPDVGLDPKTLGSWDTWVAQLVKRLPSAQVMIPASWDRVPHRAPCSAGSLLLPLPLPAILSACARSLPLSLSDK